MGWGVASSKTPSRSCVALQRTHRPCMAPAGHKGRLAAMQRGLFSAGARKLLVLKKTENAMSAYVRFGSTGTHGAVDSELRSGYFFGLLSQERDKVIAERKGHPQGHLGT